MDCELACDRSLYCNYVVLRALSLELELLSLPTHTFPVNLVNEFDVLAMPFSYKTLKDLQAAVRAIPFMGSTTATQEGMLQALGSFQKQDRPDALNVSTKMELNVRYKTADGI